MSEISTIVSVWEFNRVKTLATLTEIEKNSDPKLVLGWRPGIGRAHIAWQLLHVAITEELFATARLSGTEPAFADLVPRFKGGSVPDDEIASPSVIRETLQQSREHLLAAVSKLSDSQLDQVLPSFADRGWTMRTFLHIVAWHESHHQGQSHLTLNMYKATH